VGMVLVIVASLACISGINICSAQADQTSHNIRIVLFLGTGAHARPQVFDVLGHQNNMTLTEVYGEDIRNGCLNNYDVLFVPGGSANKESNSIEADGRDQIRQFVQNGGLYIGVCAGCYLMSSSKSADLGLLPIRTVDAAHWYRGKKFLPIEFTDLGMQVLQPKDKDMQVLYHNGPVFEKIGSDGGSSAGGIKVLARFEDEIVAPGGEPGVMTGAPAMVLGSCGKGMVIGISPHPEASPGLEYIERNAIAWMYANRNLSN